MERRPELTIIAGPNGAGKSRLCPFYVSVKSFDGDKLMLDLRREHPDWPDRWVSGTVASQLEKQKADALEQHKDFAFETNIRNICRRNMSLWTSRRCLIWLIYAQLSSMQTARALVLLCFLMRRNSGL